MRWRWQCFEKIKALRIWANDYSSQTEMVYLKSIIPNSSWSVTAIVCLICCAEAGISKSGYKKLILGKDKYQKQKVELDKTTTSLSLPKTESTVVSSDLKLNAIASTTTEMTATVNMESTAGITLTLTPKEEKDTLDTDFKSTTAMSNDVTTTSPYYNTATATSAEKISATLPAASQFTTTNAHAGKVLSSADDNFAETLPCTCGIFLSSQFTKGSLDSPRGEAIISNSLGRTFPCNSVGQKQCQTKCLEQIVQHLPNSAKILCASLDRDIRKERAYLFIKNCQHQWINTNLADGREYCCKNREPYSCK